MSDPLALADASRRLADVLPRGQPWRLADSLGLVARLAEQVQMLHQAGRTHRAIGIEAVTLVGSQSVQLDPPPTARRFGRDDANPECCPPELAELETLTLPESIVAATQILRRNGCPLDPRRIDVYQLGVLLCRLLTGKPLRAYLLDPLLKADIAPVAEPILEQALGYDSPARYEHCGPLLAALRTALDQCGQDAPQAEPRDEERSDRASGDSSAPGTAPHGSSLDANAETPPTGTTPAATPSRLQSELPCARLAHFRLLRRIGHGGMGDVYEAHDESLDRRVAVKVLPDDLARDEVFIARFRAEAWAVAHLEHPHVVSLHFIGEDGGHHFFVMDLVDGESLAQRLARERCLPLPESLRIIEQCLAGLEAAHAQGLIHRDIKPSNIMLEAHTGRVLLVDFGLVRRIDQSLLITATGLIMGTLDYISPEQARGRPADARSDLYSLGAVLYQMLAGRLPFTADTPTGMLFQHAYEPPFPLAEAVPDLPAPMVRIVQRLMAKDPAERHQSCAEVRTDLRAFQDGRPLAAVGRQSPSAALSGELRGPHGATVGVPQVRAAADAPFLPTELEHWPRGDRWQRVRDWAATLFCRHAPEFVTKLQNTTQLVDGAVAQSERRCRQLSELLAEGRRIAGELATQLRVNQELAARAEQAVSAAGEPDERQAALTQQQAYQANYASLQSQAGQQTENIEKLELEQCRAVATLARLRSQRDALQARLKAAIARGATPASPSRRSRRRWLAAAALTGFCLILGVLLVVLRPELRKPSSTPLRSKTETTAETTTALPKVATLPAQTATVSPAPPLAIAPFDEKQAKEHTSETPSSAQFHCLAGHDGIVWGVAFSPDGRYVASGGGDRFQNLGGPDLRNLAWIPGTDFVVRLWDVEAGQLVRGFEGHTAPVTSVAFSPDGRLLASASGDKTVRLWEVATGKEVRKFEGHTNRVEAVAFSANGRRLLSGSRDGSVRLWESETGRELQRFEGHTGCVWGVALSPDGERAASGGFEPFVRIWDVESGRELQQLRGHRDSVVNVAFSPDGRRLLSGAWDHTARLWNLENGQELRCLEGHTHRVEGVAISGDGKRLLTNSLDGTVRVWDAESGQQIACWEGHTGPVSKVAFSLDGRYAVSGGWDSSVRLWRQP